MDRSMRSPVTRLRPRDIPASAEQLDIFATQTQGVKAQRSVSIAERFEQFHRLNPHVYHAFVSLARERIEEGARRNGKIGAKDVWETLRRRFSSQVRHAPNAAALFDNSYVSHYARLAAANEPDLREAFEFRKRRTATASCALARFAARITAPAIGHAPRVSMIPSTTATQLGFLLY
jgi:hypothetical protein